jgi:glycosyltransferase involved in cell wall biosynthesis
MKIRLFRAFPDPYRQSMTIYADALTQALRQTLEGGGTVEDYLPQPVFLEPKLLRYFSQYVHYPVCAPAHQGTVNHIIDHAYSHLVHNLNPRKTVVTFHDAIWLKYRDSHPRKYLNFVQRLNLSGLAKAAGIICDSKASKDMLLEYLPHPQGKIEVIAPGLDPLFFNAPQPALRKALGLQDNSVYLLHVGHTGSYKNIEGVLHVLGRLQGQTDNIHLIKVGAALTSAQMDLARKLGVDQRLIFKGAVPKNELLRIYQASDFLIFPSIDEGFGFPALEAMAAGLPVIASDRGSLPEVIGEAGILKKPADHEGMAESILELIHHPDKRKALRERGLLRAQLFSWQETARKVLAFYRAAVEDAS